jgi:hypothetical protein
VSLEIFTVNDKNPNDTVGGSGCLCHPEGKATGCDGPYVVFHAAETDSGYSPYCVVGAACVRAAAKKLDGEALAAGEDVGASD